MLSTRPPRQFPGPGARRPPQWPPAEGPVVSPRLLAFDTSTEALAVAVQADAGSSPGTARAARWPRRSCCRRSAACCSRPGWNCAQLQAIAFGRGPGRLHRPAHGLRRGPGPGPGGGAAGAAAGQPDDRGRGRARGSSPDAPADIDVVMDARMDEVYAGRYRWDGARWQVLAAPALCSLDALHAAWALQPPRCVAGSALAAFGERLRSGDGAAHRRRHRPRCRAAAPGAAAVARRRWHRCGGRAAAVPARQGGADRGRARGAAPCARHAA